MNRRNNRFAGAIFLLLWTLFIAKSFIYVSITPIWEGFDELFHFSYIDSLVNDRELPTWGSTFVDTSIADSTALVPLPKFMPLLAKRGAKLSHSEYWRLDPAERERLELEFREVRADATGAGPSEVANYQAQHPPLYYSLCVPIYLATYNCSLVDQVFAIRLFSALLASLCVIAMWLIARKIDSENAAFPALLIVAWPCLFIDTARVGNDSLGIAIFSFIFLSMLSYAIEPSRKSALSLGFLTGLGLLTKAYFLTTVPVVLLFMVGMALRNRGAAKRILIDALIAVACLAAVGGWWYVRNHLLYGSFSGLQESVLHPSVGLFDRFRAVFEIPWAAFIKNLFVNFCWISGWSFVRLPKMLYLVFAGALAVMAVGLIKLIISSRGSNAPEKMKVDSLLTALCLVAFFVLGGVYHQVNAFATVKALGGFGGWYLYALVAPICFAAATGLSAWRRYSGWLLLMILLSFAVTEWFGILFVLIPYYTGMAVSGAGGWGVDFHGGPGLLFSREILARILSNKPAALSPVLLAISVFVCLAAQVTVFCHVFCRAKEGWGAGRSKGEPAA